MKYRMHKRVETKPDGRKIYYYTYEPAQERERETPPDAPAEPASESNTESNAAGDSWGRETTFQPSGYHAD